MPKINPLMFLAAPYAVNEFAVKPTSEIYGAYRGIKDQFTKDAENAEQVRLRKRQYDRTISDEDKVDMLQGYTGSDPKFVENLGKETTTALSDKQIKEIEKIQLKDTQDLITNLQTSKDAAKTLRDFNAEGRLHLGTLDKVKDGIAQLRNTFESAYKVADEQTKQEKKMKFQAEVAPVFVDTTMTPQQKVQFIYQTATKHGLDPDATLKDYMDMSKNTFGPTQTGAVGRTSFKFRTNELGKVDPIAQSVATVRGEGGDGGSKDYKAAVKERWKDFNKAQTQYLKAVGGQEVLAFDEAGGPLGSTKRTFSTDELNLLRSVMNDKRRAYQEVSGAKTRVINDKPKTGKQTKPTSAIKVTYDKDGNLVIQR